MIIQGIFVLLLVAAVYLFTVNVKKIIRNINMGRDVKINDQKKKRWWLMFKVAIRQTKMTTRPVAGIMHLLVFLGFILVNIEMIEILIDGIFGTHRLFSFIGTPYKVLVTAFEFFAFAVMFGCAIFLIRRNVLRLKRFHSKELTRWPLLDANIILTTEILLMFAVLTMNATDSILQSRGVEHYPAAGSFFISSFLQPLYVNMSTESLIFLERFCWWFHIVGVFAFLNYIPYSKHFHVFLSFPNVWYSKLTPRAEIENMDSITNEVKLMLDPSAVPPPPDPGTAQFPFGVKDLKDLTWKNIMDAFTCTECGRCTSSCPANITGKKLSPRKVLMDVRDHAEIVGKDIRNKKDNPDSGKSLFDYITAEELWACTTCNACTQECPVNIDHVNILINMRRYLVMEKAAAPGELNAIFTNIENNGAPWQFSPEDRLLWANNLEINVK